MPQIKVLPDHLINQIAAGEVVERPASVVKELLENSLDAGAKKIIVEVEAGGDALLRITDDGCGMDKDDAVLAFARHATSKISILEDLFRINSYGFRGEAIASIASVSLMTIQTKKAGALEGTIVSAEGGQIRMVKAIGAPEGTQIEVRNLFFNTPARKKYLKNDATEYGHILSTVTSMALASPQVSFKLIHDGKTVFDLPASEDVMIRIRSLLGRDMAENLVPVFYGHSKILLTGFVGKPSIARASRLGQYLFVNGREVKSHVLSYAVKQSFYSLLPKEKYPVFILFFQIDPMYVDVNVHPRKMEVRFSDEKEIFKIVISACGKALENYVLAPKIEDQKPEEKDASQITEQTELSAYSSQRVQQSLKLEDHDYEEAYRGAKTMAAVAGAATVNGSLNGVNEDAIAFTQAVTQGLYANEQANFTARENDDLIQPLAQLAESYILCRQGNSLLIIDQHAAHERIRYTEIVAEFEAKQSVIQQLLTPMQFELSHQEKNILEQNLELFAGLGFSIEPFGGNTFNLTAIPSYMAKHDLLKAIHGLIDDLNNMSVKGDFQSRKEKALTYMACRSAVKFGDKLSMEEMEGLVRQLQTLAQPYTCPHGRPTMAKMDFEELEKRFGRRK
ncbi:MAG TPA: DNA mismatch repair endonuclease MutL [Candidatus Gracilibacteria bacterium]|nr:DNA mismatch repair endonuclease MutL [Candidatus Gracilibacteria bacterium]